MRASAAALVVGLLGVGLEPSALAQGLELSASPATLLLGEDQTAEVRITAGDEGGATLRAMRLEVSVGSVSLPRRIEPGVWVAQYTPPRGRSPRIALLLARGDGPGATVFGGALVPLVGRAELPVQTDAGAALTVTVGERVFGPVRAGADGLAVVPLEVPPAVDTARALSVDAVGNRTSVEVPLDVPPYPRALVLAPLRATAGTTAQVAVLTVDRNGAISLRPQVSASRGLVRTARSGPAVVVVDLAVPERVGAGTLRVAASPEDDDSPAVATIVIEPREPAGLALTADRDAVVPGSRQVVTIRAAVRDRFGNVRPRDPVSLAVDGDEVAVTEAPEGGVWAAVPAPSAERGLGPMVVRARSGAVEESLVIDRVGGAPALARLEVPEGAVADGATAVPIRVLLVGETGLPAGDPPLLRASAGTLRDLRRGEDGWWEAEYVPPRGLLGWPRSVTIEAGRGAASARSRLSLLQPEPWLGLGIAGGVQANLGALVAPAARLELMSRFRLGVGWLEVALFSGFAYARTSTEVERGTATLRLFQVPIGGGLGWGARLGGPVGLHVAARGGGLLVVAEDLASFQGSTARLVVTAFVEGTVAVTVRLVLGELLARIGYAYAPAPDGSGLSGNIWGLVAFVGYRVYLI